MIFRANVGDSAKEGGREGGREGGNATNYIRDNLSGMGMGYCFGIIKVIFRGFGDTGGQ